MYVEKFVTVNTSRTNLSGCIQFIVRMLKKSVYLLFVVVEKEKKNYLFNLENIV